jgi:hypothetical protein
MEPRKTTRAKNSATGASIDDVIGDLGGTERSSGVARNAGGDGTQKAGIVSNVKNRATAQLASQKDRATDQLGTIAQAVRHSSERLRADQHETVAQYVEKAAEQLDRFSHNLREKDINELLQDAQSLARRQPALFIGGSFAVGLLAARFLKSSRERSGADVEYRAPEYRTSDYRTGEGY